MCPKSVISYCVVCFYEKLKVGIVYLSLDHPLLNHGEDWTGDFFYYSVDKLFRLRTAGKHERVYCRTYCTTS